MENILMGLVKVKNVLDITADTVADLANVQHKTGNIQLLGFHTKGDGGGGVFYWDATKDKSEHNGGTVIDPDKAGLVANWASTQALYFTPEVTGQGCWVREYSGAVNVKWFGAKGDYNGVSGTDNTNSIQNAINLKVGVTFDTGYYYVENALTISNFNSSNTYLDTVTTIKGNESKIIVNPSITNTYALLINNCKRLIVEGLTIGHSSFIEVDGLWESSFNNCGLGTVKFAPNNLDTFDSHYWNTFKECSFGTLEFHTGTSGDRTEFNSNLFISCKIWYGEYAFKVYGNQNLQGNTFLQCDISYQTVGLLYVDEQISDGNINIIGGYFDSNVGFPLDTKGVNISSYATVNCPNSANLDSFKLGTGSRVNVDVTSGVRNGSRFATSSLNLFKNGDLSSGTPEGLYGSSGLTPTILDGDGYFGKYARFSTTQTRSVGFESIPVPFTGWYNITVVGKIIEGFTVNNTSINGVAGTYGAINLPNDEIGVSSFQGYFNKGDVVKVSFSSVSGEANTIDLHYASLTFGRYGSLGCPLHPDASFIKKDYEEVDLKKEYLSGSADTNTTIKTITVGTYTRKQLEITIFGTDTGYPDGSLYSKYAVVLSRSGSSSILSNVSAIAQLEAGATTGYPVISAVNNGDGTVSINLTMPNGTAYYKAELFGFY
jgi:hypothetical protein